MASTPRARRTLTFEEFLKLPGGKPYLEYLGGEVNAKKYPPMGTRLLQATLASRLHIFAAKRHLGLVFLELRFDFGGWSIVPEIGFLLHEHIARGTDGEILDDSEGVPDLHVEIVLTEPSRTKQVRKLVHSSANGCPLGWLVDPYDETIEVYRPGKAPERLGVEDTLTGQPVLPQFRLQVAELFEWQNPDAVLSTGNPPN